MPFTVTVTASVMVPPSAVVEVTVKGLVSHNDPASTCAAVLSDAGRPCAIAINRKRTASPGSVVCGVSRVVACIDIAGREVSSCVSTESSPAAPEELPDMVGASSAPVIEMLTVCTAVSPSAVDAVTVKVSVAD